MIRYPIQLLLVEDNPAHARLVCEAFDEAEIANEIQVVADGEQAMRYLRGEGEFAGAGRPDVVLLDLNLPRMDGREVLTSIKNDPELHSIPVVVLTTSAAAADVRLAYANYANAYIRKPVDFEEFIDAIKAFESFWLSVATLPPHERGGETAPSPEPAVH